MEMTMGMTMEMIMEMTKKMIMEMVIEEKRGLCELFLVAFLFFFSLPEQLWNFKCSPTRPLLSAA